MSVEKIQFLSSSYQTEFSPLASPMHLPKEQRRGAIIILGMLAIAKPRDVLGDRVEVMLKVGLGKLGKVCAHVTFHSFRH